MTEGKRSSNAVEEYIKRSGFLSKACQLLVTRLMAAESPILQWAALVFIKLPAIQISIKEAKEHLKFANYKAFGEYPDEIKAWAAMDLQKEESERKRVELLNENLKQATPKLKEITQERYAKIREVIDNLCTEKITRRGKNAGEFATILKHYWGSLTTNDPNLNRLFKKPPSAKTISRALNDTKDKSIGIVQ